MRTLITAMTAVGFIVTLAACTTSEPAADTEAASADAAAAEMAAAAEPAADTEAVADAAAQAPPVSVRLNELEQQLAKLREGLNADGKEAGDDVKTILDRLQKEIEGARKQLTDAGPGQDTLPEGVQEAVQKIEREVKSLSERMG